MDRTLLPLVPAAALVFLCPASAHANDDLMGEAIRLTAKEIEAYTVATPPAPRPRGTQSTSGFSIDRQNRTAVAAAYHRYYLDSDQVGGSSAGGSGVSSSVSLLRVSSSASAGESAISFCSLVMRWSRVFVDR